VRDQLLDAWEDGSWGRYEARFCAELTEHLRALHGVDHTLLCSSGTIGVELALRGLRVKAGDEVVLAAYDFPGNFRAVEAVGAFPVLVDIDPRSWCLDPAQLSAALGPKTRAVIVSHLHGGLADMESVMETAREANLGVVEDACQAPGAVVQGRSAGSWGDIGVLSFGGSKLLTAGRGGALLTNNPSILQRVKIFQERGNAAFPLSELQAAVLMPQLEMLEQRNRTRADRVQQLIDAWQQQTLLQPVLPSDQPGMASYYKLALQYRPVIAENRASGQFINALLAEGIAAGAGFRGFVRRSARRCRCVGTLQHAAEAAANTVLLHHPVLLQDRQYIARLAQAVAKVARHFTTKSDNI
jgi:dTDP-4-amino-4,6-dideoxygalactose transaminase